MDADRKAKQNFDVLDGLRGIAAISVVCIHVPDRTAAQMLPASYLAVDLFFAMSGFVIAYAYTPRLSCGLRAAQFMLERLIRLYPMYILGTLIAAVYTVAYDISHKDYYLSKVIFITSSIFSLLFLPTPPTVSLSPLVAFPLLGPAWSLFWELWANLLFAILALKFSNKMLILLIITSSMILINANWGNGSIDQGVLWSGFFGGGARVFFSFPVGVALFRLWQSGRVPVVLPWQAAPAILVLTLALQPQNQLKIFYDLSVIFFVYPLLILASASVKMSGFSSLISKWLGRTSYGIYALHSPFVVIFNIFTIRLFGNDMHSLGLQSTILFICAMFFIVTVLDIIYDRPVRNFLRSLLA